MVSKVLVPLSVSTLLLFACGGSPSSSTNGAPEPPAADDAGAEDAGVGALDAAAGSRGPSDAAVPPADAAAACRGMPTQPLDQTVTVHSGGVDRTALLHVPASHSSTDPVAVVLNFHAYLSDANTQNLYSGMNAKADAEGFVAVHPQGIGNSWNAGACCGQSEDSGVDDVMFVSDLLDKLATLVCVDERRVFATGMSNGGFFTHRLGCELSSRIAAIAPVAGVVGVDTCTPTRSVPIIEFHGTADTVVPYDGSAALGFVSVPETFDGWATRDGCTGAQTQTLTEPDSQCSGYTACESGSSVILCTVNGGGHTWPGGTQIPGVYTSPFLIATDQLWSFFLAHPM